jgi:hypothetical protein
LVLACRDCNRGINGKFTLLPKIKYLERLHKRNSFLIDSHHPLRETLMAQTGDLEEQRRLYLNHRYTEARKILIQHWQPINELAPAF